MRSERRGFVVVMAPQAYLTLPRLPGDEGYSANSRIISVHILPGTS